MKITKEQEEVILSLARESISFGASHRTIKTIDLQGYSPDLQEERATFVTLKKTGHLRGCIGTIDAIRPLALDVVQNAYAAAFRDSRFPPVEAEEVDQLGISISILSPRTAIHFVDEDDLLQQLRPGTDGLVLQDRYYCGAFLPVMWDTFRDPKVFFTHLKIKAGLPKDYWSDSIQVTRFMTEFYLKSDKAGG